MKRCFQIEQEEEEEREVYSFPPPPRQKLNLLKINLFLPERAFFNYGVKREKETRLSNND